MLNIVIDLEMCKVPQHYKTKMYTRGQETIEIGAAFFDESWKQVGSFRRFVHPEHGVIDTEIKKLTNIDNKDTKKAALLKDALVELIEQIGDNEYKLYAWSPSDRNQLVYEAKVKEFADERLDAFLDETKWVDYQAIYGERFGFELSQSLELALTQVGIELEGHQHDGLDDAINTGKLIAKLELDKDFVLPEPEAYSDTSDSFGSSLGSIFANLGIH